jgi:hypothetical protein
LKRHWQLGSEYQDRVMMQNLVCNCLQVDEIPCWLVGLVML